MYLNTPNIDYPQELAPILLKGCLKMEDADAKEFKLALSIKGIKTSITYRDYDLPNKRNIDVSFIKPLSEDVSSQLNQIIDEAVLVSSILFKIANRKEYNLTIIR